jgi:hypothetical protein
LHLDTRTRQEGLDLFYRVQRVLPAGEQEGIASGRGPGRAGLVLLTAAAGLFVNGGAARAGEPPLDAVRAARGGVQEVRAEVKAADPYPGGARWEGRLRALGTRLGRAGDGDARRFRWFDQALEGFADRQRDGALHVLTDLDRRLSLTEESLAPAAGAGGQPAPAPDDVKSLLRKQGPAGPRGEARMREKKQAEREEEERREIERDDPAPARQGGGGRTAAPAAAGGFGLAGWVVLAGLAAAVLAVACLLFFSSRQGPRPAKAPVKEAPEKEPGAPYPLPREKSAGELWRQAEALAGEGRFPEALRLLYLSVLFLLDRKHLLRYEPTRTNGEYVRQVRLSEQAPPALHDPFEQLTALFETKWYGDRACEAADYRAAAGLAGEVRDQAGAA